MIRERILFRLFFSLLLLLSFSPFCTYEPTSQIHPKVCVDRSDSLSHHLLEAIVLAAHLMSLITRVSYL